MRRRTTKLFVDSRFAVGGTSGSSILYEIPDGIELGPYARAWVSEFTCVAAFNTLDETNRYQTLIEDGGLSQRLLVLPSGAHDLESLRAALEEQLGTGYTVERVSSGTGGSTFRLFRVSRSSGTFTLPHSPLSRIVAFPGAEAAEQVSGFVDLRRCHNIFVHSPSFGNYNTVGPGGIRTCLCKIPVDAGYGGLVRWQTSGSEHDYIECGVRSLRVLRLELRDSDGVLLDLAGTAFSLTILFSDE